jgi:TetR/AcrR family transcriptional regulator, ethionamide resistance regulator
VLGFEQAAAHDGNGSLTEVSVATQSRAQTAILEATERLLRERPLRLVSVADIIEAAGVSRTSFYAYFASKTAVIAECLREVMDQVMVAARPFHAQSGGDAEAAIRVSLLQWVEVCKTHGALLRTVSEEWPHDAEIRALWFEALETVTAGTARVIRSARQSGRAPAGADPRALAACLMWGYERVLHVALVGDAVGLPDPDAIVEPLAQMMVGGLYGLAPAAGAAPGY